MRHSGQAASAVLVIITMLAGCGAPSPTPSPSASAQPSTPARQQRPPRAHPHLPPRSHPLRQAIRSSARSRRRSRATCASARCRPSATTSIKYEPLLPTGTKLQVVGGPVEASGYTWYEVEPVGFDLGGGVRRGWVASADHDGTPWIAVADPPITGLDGRDLGRRPCACEDGRGEASRGLRQRFRRRPVQATADRGRGHVEWRQRRLLADEHRARARDGPGRCKGRDGHPDGQGPAHDGLGCPRTRVELARPGARVAERVLEGLRRGQAAARVASSRTPPSPSATGPSSSRSSTRSRPTSGQA